MLGYVKRFERSAAIERLERLEQASVLNSADPGCGDFDPAGFPGGNSTVRRSCLLTDWEMAKKEARRKSLTREMHSGIDG